MHVKCDRVNSYEMLFIKKKKPSLNMQSDSIRVKLEHLKELHPDILSHFLHLAKQPSTRGKPQNISLVRQKNTKDEIINQEGTRMVKDGED